MFYQHYKGGYYRMVCVATNEKDGSPVVVYQCLINGRCWARKASDFFDKVQPAGYPEPVPRFKGLTNDPRQQAEGEVVPITSGSVPTTPSILPPWHQ